MSKDVTDKILNIFSTPILHLPYVKVVFKLEYYMIADDLNFVPRMTLATIS